jgi:ANTAR domain
MSTGEATHEIGRDRLPEVHPPAVYQAEGVLMARLDLSIDQAAQRLRDQAAAAGHPVVEAARQVMDEVAARARAGGSRGPR